MSSSSELKSQTRKPNTSEYPAWAPRFWHGMLLGDWIKLVIKNRFRIHPLRLGLATTVTALTSFNSAMRIVDKALHHRKVNEAKLVDDPVFILGHWRAGTTFLHELMSCDERFATPTTFQCFAANHFLVTQAWMPKVLWFLMPRHRPMDKVRLGWYEPQEDEFALCSMGADSPYLRMAFPKNGDWNLNYLDMEGLSQEEIETWQQTLGLFLKRVSLQTGKRLILKSPTHTGRIRMLQEMYPKARFIHIVRDARSLLPSTLKLWNSLDDAHGLQFRRFQPDQLVLQSFQRMYSAFERDRKNVPSSQIADIRYEDLVADPVGQLRRVYEELELGDFSTVATPLNDLLAEKKGYQTNRYELNDQVLKQIEQTFGEYQRRYGYEV